MSRSLSQTRAPACSYCQEPMCASGACTSCLGEDSARCWLCHGHGALYHCDDPECEGKRDNRPSTAVLFGYDAQPPAPRKVAAHAFEDGRCILCNREERLAGRYGWACEPRSFL